MAKIKNSDNTNAGSDMEKFHCSVTAGSNVK
jgi:hypothetical protein